MQTMSFAKVNRRDFISKSLLASLGGAAFWASACRRSESGYAFPVEVISSHAAAHAFLRQTSLPEAEPQAAVDVAIVGGGMAGMSAAYALRDRNIKIFELEKVLGGSASAVQHQGQWQTLGAHYDLTYPAYFGQRPLKMLEELGLIYFDTQQEFWHFSEKQHIISPQQEGQVFHHNNPREDVLAYTALSDRFLAEVNRHLGQLVLPTTHIAEPLHSLNKYNFYQWLQEKGLAESALLESVNYQLRDDFGGSAYQVSALAGLYYYGNRPYRTSKVEVFSPPQGNYYFVQALDKQLAATAVQTGQLVHKIEAKSSGFSVYSYDVQQQKQLVTPCKKVIYAGHKHALPHVLPAEKELFAQQQYVPWVVLSIVVKNTLPVGFWQNEWMGAPEGSSYCYTNGCGFYRFCRFGCAICRATALPNPYCLLLFRTAPTGRSISTRCRTHTFSSYCPCTYRTFLQLA